MEQKEIETGNKLIAEFMQFDVEGNIHWIVDEDKPISRTTGRTREIEVEGTVQDLQYHTSWDWLMPVVEKITTIEDGKFNVDISTVGMWTCYIKRDDVFEKEISDFGGFTPVILNVWKAVVKFIKWYNSNSQ